MLRFYGGDKKDWPPDCDTRPTPEVLTQSDTKIPFRLCWRQLFDVANKITSSAKKADMKFWSFKTAKSALPAPIAPRCSRKNHHRTKGSRGYSNPCCRFPLPFLHSDKARLDFFLWLKIISDVISKSPSNSVKVTATSHTINLHPQQKGYFQRSLIKLCLCPLITA